ncbi:MAG TPA: hypothetical protein PLF84_14890 [Bryobacteraceae bacterium]|nr:hypothetical protein [Bryobacteraceae bacterium]
MFRRASLRCNLPQPVFAASQAGLLIRLSVQVGATGIPAIPRIPPARMDFG